MRRIRFVLVSLLLTLVLVTGNLLAASVFFDDFTDPAGAGWSWSLGANGTGQKYVDFAYNSTLLYLHDSGSNPEFVLVGRNDAFDNVNAYWRLSIRFRFPSITAYGSNIASGTALFDPNSRQPQSQPVRTDWQDVLLIHQYSGAFYIDAFGTQHYNVPGAGDTNWHTLGLEVADGSYVLRLDGAQIGSGSTGGIVPRSLWFGNYFTQNWWGNFTDIQVDWVRVETDREPPTTTASLSGTAGNGGWYRSNVQVALSASDAWSGVAVTEYRVDGGLWQVYHGPFTVSGDGSHTVEYRSTDSAGNTEAVQSLPVRIDTVPPVTTEDLTGTPGLNGWYRSTVQVDLTAGDATSGVAATCYRVDGGPWQTYTGPFTVSSDGDHTVEYYSVDVAGNQEAAKSTRVPIDTTPPSTSATPSGTAGNGGWWRSDVQVSLSASDGTSGVAFTRYRVDGDGWTDYTGPFTVTGEGSHTVEYRSGDRAGNVEPVQTLDLRIDTVPPASTITTPSDGDWISGTVTVEGTAADGTSGVALVSWSNDGGSTWQAASGTTSWSAPWDTTAGPDGDHRVCSRADDVAGNREILSCITVHVDNTPPSTTASPTGTAGNGGWWRSDVQVSLSADDGSGIGVASTEYRVDGGAWQAYTGPFVVTGDGSHMVEYRSTDGLGNREAVRSLQVRIDTEPPSTTASPSGTVGANGWYVSDVQVGLAASDATSGVDGTEYRIDGGSWQVYSGPFTVSGDRVHTVEYRSTDAAGNAEAVQTLDLRIDTVPPSTTASPTGTAGNGGWWLSDVEVALSASDTTSGVDVTMYRLDGGTWQAYSGPFTVAGDGTHTVEYRSADVAGNTEAVGSLIVRIDTVPPSTTASPTGTVGNGGWWLSDVQIALSASDATSGVGVTRYQVDGGGWADYSGPFTVGGDGTHTIAYRSTDVAGNVEADRVLTVRIDTVPPATTAATDGLAGNGGWWKSAVTVTLTAADGTSGVAFTRCRVDGGGWPTCTAPFTVTGEGEHTVEYGSTDVAGNVETTGTLALRIDTVPPTTTAALSGTVGMNGWYTTRVALTLTAVDGGSGVEVIFLNGEVVTGPVVYADDGRYEVTYHSRDAAGNEEPARVLAFGVDETPPQVEVVGGSFCPGCGEVLLIQPRAVDWTSGVETWRLEVRDGGRVVRAWSGSGGPTSIPWDGRDGSGRQVGVGAYDLRLWVQDRAGWTAEAAGQVRVTSAPLPPSPPPPTATPTATPTSTSTPTPTPTRAWTPAPTATPFDRLRTTPRPGETPTPPPPTPIPPTPTPVPVALVEPEAEPGVILLATVFEDTNGDGYRQPEERGLAGLRVEVTGEGWMRAFYADSLGLVAVRLPGPGVYRFVLADRPGPGWEPTTRAVLEVRVGPDRSVAVLPTGGGRKPLPVGLAEGVPFAFGLAPRRVGLVPLSAAALLFIAVLTAVLDRRARAIRELGKALTMEG